MARQPRIEYEGAVYHVMARGDRREDIFNGDADREMFLETLGEACEKTGMGLYAWVLMSNHYHFVLETPGGNLVEGMKWFQNTYTRRFNSRHRVWGHVFGGRYKAIVAVIYFPGWALEVYKTMKEDEFFESIERLRTHLQRVEPIISEFCDAHGFARVNSISIGRYPRIRIEKIDTLHRWFDLSMALTPEGKRYTEFFERIPYELSAGCFVDCPDETQYGHRFQKSYACFVDLSFEMVPGILREELEKNFEVINSWTAESLKKEGLKKQLG